MCDVKAKKENSNICAYVLTFSVKLEKWLFHVADLPRTGKKCTEIKNAREGRANLLCTLFFFYKNVVFPAQAEYSYFSSDFRLKIFLYYS